MKLGFPALLIKILACIPIDRYKKIGTICIKDTCLQILFAAAQDPQSRGLANSSAARSLCYDRWARNKQYTQNKSNRIANRGISV
jgi:hypothetical protein